MESITTNKKWGAAALFYDHHALLQSKHDDWTDHRIGQKAGFS